MCELGSLGWLNSDGPSFSHYSCVLFSLDELPRAGLKYLEIMGENFAHTTQSHGLLRAAANQLRHLRTLSQPPRRRHEGVKRKIESRRPLGAEIELGEGHGD